MTKNKNHELIIHFDHTQLNINKLWELSKKVLNPELSLHVGISEGGDLEIIINGTLEEVDRSHIILEKYFFEELHFDFFRLKDTAGDEIRRKAYSILSTIEQELRSFINHCLIDALGFRWWASLGESTLPTLSTTYKSSKNHPLELMTIEQLIEFVTREKADWEEIDNVSLLDFTELINRSISFDDFRGLVNLKIKKYSLWNDVFSKYLTINQKEWGNFKKNDFEYIINLRNRVMHHRPVHLQELITLEEKKANLNKIISTAKSHLSNEDREKIANQTKEIRSIYSDIIYEYTEKDTVSTLRQSLQKANNLLVIERISKEIGNMLSTSSITEKQYLELKITTVYQMKQIIGKDYSQSLPIIKSYLLPMCVQENTDFRFIYSEFRKILVAWIEEHSQEDSESLRDQIISYLLPLIGTENHKPVCWTLSALGFRNQEIVNALNNFASHWDNENGDIALQTIILLGTPQNETNYILEELHRRVKERFNYYLLSGLSHLGNKNSIKVIIEEWITKENRENKKIDLSLAFTTIREILNRNDEDSILQDETWDSISKIVSIELNTVYWDFDIGHVIAECNSPLVIPDLFSWFSNNQESFEKPDWAFYLAEDRIEKCIKPRQLEGWSNISKKSISSLLHKQATSNTKNDLFATTQESSYKMSAWKTLLRSGYQDSLSWFDEAVTDEEGRFIRQQLMEYLSCFKIDPLPIIVKKWIIDTHNSDDSSDGREYAYRIAAHRIARSAATEEAFDAILNSGLTINGYVPLETIDALTDIVINLLRCGKVDIVNILVKKVIEFRTKPQSILAACAVEFISEFQDFQNLLRPHIPELIKTLYDEKRDSLEKEKTLLMLSNYNDVEIPDYLFDDLIKWALEKDHWLSEGSIIVLSNQGYLEKHPEILENLFGIEFQGANFNLDKIKNNQPWMPYIIGKLYFQNPIKFQSLVSSYISICEFSALPNLLNWILAVHDKSCISISEEIINSIIQRIIHFSPFGTYTNLFEVLLLIAPDALVNSFPIDVFKNWIPEAQIEFINSLGRLSTNVQLKTKALRLLEIFTENENYSIRRTAYRAIAKIDLDFLISLSRSWFDSSLTNLQVKTAEAIGWVLDLQEPSIQNYLDEFIPLLTYHQNRIIRDASTQSINDHKKRRWSKEYFFKITKVSGDNNEEIFQNYCYGDALGLIGDDEIEELLKNYLKTKIIPPNIRFWIFQIIEQIEKNWKNVTQKWKEPINNLKGLIERGNGTINNFHDPLVDIQYTLWMLPSDKPMGISSWGGVMIIPTIKEFLDLGEAEICTSDGRCGKIIMSNLQGNSVSFIGNGKFPEFL